MEKINTEILVSSLFIMGFDKVDDALFTYTLGQLSIDNKQLQLFEFEDSETHQLFNKYVDYDGIVFKLKVGITLGTMASYNGGKFYPLRKMLNTSKKLIEYLSQLDFSGIVLKKAESYGIQNIEQIDESRFSNKEIDILKKLEKKYIHEEIIQEIFRQLLIKNNIANDYVLIFEDYFKLIKDKYKGVSGTINVFKDQNNMWNVWEIDGDGENYNISNFDNQIEAYIDAAKRRGLNFNFQDFAYDENDVNNLLNIIESARSFLKVGIDFYGDNATKLNQRFLLLGNFENKIIKENNLNGKKLVRNKK